MTAIATRRSTYTPRRGDVIRFDFDPSAGHEQQGTGPALVLSPEAFNRFGLALAFPVAHGGAFARGQAWTVPLVGNGLGTDGVVLCNQKRTVDWKARRAEFVETVPAEIVADVLARVATLIELKPAPQRHCGEAAGPGPRTQVANRAQPARGDRQRRDQGCRTRWNPRAVVRAH